MLAKTRGRSRTPKSVVYTPHTPQHISRSNTSRSHRSQTPKATTKPGRPPTAKTPTERFKQYKKLLKIEQIKDNDSEVEAKGRKTLYPFGEGSAISG